MTKKIIMEVVSTLIFAYFVEITIAFDHKKIEKMKLKYVYYYSIIFFLFFFKYQKRKKILF